MRLATVARVALLLVVTVAGRVTAECPATTFDILAPAATMNTVPDQVEWLVTPTKARVFAKTEGGSVYKSNNAGASWINVTPTLLGTSDSGIGASSAASKNVLQILHQEGSEFMIFQGYGNENWATKDMGDTWIQPCGLPGVSPDACFTSPLTGHEGAALSSLFKMHPTLPMHVLTMTMRAACRLQDMATDTACGQDLMYSADFGQSWTNLTQVSDDRVAGFVDFDWAPPIDGEMDDGKPGILATIYESTAAMADGRAKSWDYNVHFVYSTDLFGTAHNRLLRCGNAFEVLNGDVYVAQLRDCEAFHSNPTSATAKEFPGTDIALQISTDTGKSFKQACFPVALSQRGYTIFDFHTTLGGPDFISIDHDEEDKAEASAPMGNIYSSDDTLQLFSLNMRRNVRYGGNAVDFANVEGVDGVYVANQISDGGFADPSFIAKTKTIEDFVHTRITYNGGGAWQTLKPPVVDNAGAPIVCHAGNTCDLHLHGASHWQRGTWETRLGSVYSQESAPGVILATGNVGEFLSYDAQSVNTYLSRDAGVTWEEILKGPHIYEFGNHGGLIVAAKMASLGPTNKVYFTRDEGLCWEGPITLARPLSVHNIRVDPGGTGDVFIIHGTDSQSTDGDPDGVVYTLDFTRLNEKDPATQAVKAWVYPVCDPAKDYELWTPTPPGPPGACILGRNYTMQRRRRDSRCLNKADFERTETKETVCECNKDFDTECQFGSERRVDFGKCDLMTDTDLTTCPALLGKDLPKSNMRIIAGSKCLDSTGALGKDTFKIGDDKGGTGGGNGSNDKKSSGVGRGFLIFFLVFLSLGGLGAGGFLAYNKYDLQRFVPPQVKSVAQTLKDKVEEMTGRKRYTTPAGYFEPLGDFGGEDI
mmetsp:Transcript_42694/g.68664  ORF Transcript_42694/g.68664 Transcript_42694/m.68664 type:complete len:874 (+) Transcript_42694:54-2675(+)